MRRILFRLALIGFLCRALVPAGFMPAPLSDGGPIRLCHGGQAGAAFALLENARAVESASSHEQHAPADVGHDAHHASHASGDHDAAGKDQRAAHEGWDRCPVGAAFAFAFIAADAPLAEPAQAEPVALDESVTLVVRELAEGYLARAPPRV